MTVHVTRMEIARYLEQLFADGAAGKEALLAAVTDARPDIQQVLRQLPDRRYTALRQVWEDLPHIPVEL